MNKFILYLIAPLLAGAIFSCVEERDCSAGPDISELNRQKLEADIAVIENYLEENNIEYLTHPSGIRYSIVEAGDGSSPTYCSTMQVDFEGRLLGDPETFVARTDVQFAMSSNFIVQGLPLTPGLQFGLITMNRRADYRLFIPSPLAFGEEGIMRPDSTYLVPPNTNVEFRMRLTRY